MDAGEKPAGKSFEGTRAAATPFADRQRPPERQLKLAGKVESAGRAFAVLRLLTSVL
jgi:hypothetical protein